MGTQISGKAGEVRVAGATVDGIKSWTLDYTSDALETTDFGDSGHKTYIAGIDGWSGSFEGFKDGQPTGIGTEIALVLMESTTASQLYTGQAIITGSHPTASVDGIVGIAYDFQGTGALTPASA
jgi:hypothetical protein